MRVNVVVEGQSDLGAVSALVKFAGHELGDSIDKRGKGNLDPKIPSYNLAARFEPWVVFRDTDGTCPVELRSQLSSGIGDWSISFLLRLAHSMTEAWLLADREGFASYFKVPVDIVPRDPESLAHAKQTVLQLCARSRSRDIREGMVAGDGEVGPLYVAILNDFAMNHWDIEEAVTASDSLRRAADRIRTLAPPGRR